MNWTELEISTYQDHVIKHVLGATILGWFVAEDAVHFALDVGLLWSVYVNSEMSLMALFVAIEDLESEGLSQTMIQELISDAQALNSNGREATDLKHFKSASVDCLVERIEVLGNEARRRVKVIGEVATIEIQTWIDHSTIRITESSR